MSVLLLEALLIRGIFPSGSRYLLRELHLSSKARLSKGAPEPIFCSSCPARACPAISFLAGHNVPYPVWVLFLHAASRLT